MIASPRSSWPQVALALALVAAAFHLPWIDRPLDPSERNLGHYFGIAAKVWEHFGFFELRGAPFWLTFPQNPATGFAYLNHPPGVFWMMYACGADEWALRLPGTVAAWLASLGLYRLLESRVRPGLAAGAALGYLGCRGVAGISIGSYENVVVAFGVWFWFVTERLNRDPGDGERRRLVLVQVALAVAGVWSDWMFGFYALATVALVGGRVGDTVRRLWRPGCAALVSAGLVLAWQTWVRAGRPSDAGSAPNVGSTLASWLLDRPPLARWLAAARDLTLDVAGLPACMLAVIGIVIMLRRQPRLLAALTIAGVSPIVAFSKHALDHGVFYTLATPLVFVAASAPLEHLARWWPRAAVTVSLIVAAYGFWVSGKKRHELDSPIMRDVGAALVAEAERDGGGRMILTDFPYVFQYYVDHPMVLSQTVTQPSTLDAFRGVAQAPRGVRFLWWSSGDGTPLGQYLRGLPSEPALLDSASPVPALVPARSPTWVTLEPR